MTPRLPLAGLSLLLLLAAPLRAGDGESSCATNCHVGEQKALEAGVHAAVLRCTDCHGGDATAQRDKAASHSEAAGFRGRPARQDIPQLCGSCHSEPLKMFAFGLPTDQLAQYRTSRHGEALFGRGDGRVAVCTDCHDTHRILPASDPEAPTHRGNQPATCGRCHANRDLMDGAGLPSDVVADFTGSVHGKALLVDEVRDAPSCADCHGAHGTAPPGVADIVAVCAHCHENTGEEYRKSPHAVADGMRCAACHEEAADVPALRRSGCAACHGTHAIGKPGKWMLEGDQPGRCGHCHRQPDASRELVAALTDGTAQLRSAMDETLAQIHAAKDHGLFLENEQVYLKESQRTLVSVEPLSHSMDAGAIRAHLEDGLRRQDRTREMIERKGKLLRDRRVLLGGASLVLLMLAGLMLVKLDALRKLS